MKKLKPSLTHPVHPNHLLLWILKAVSLWLRFVHLWLNHLSICSSVRWSFSQSIDGSIHLPSVRPSIIGSDLGCPLYPSALPLKGPRSLKGGTWCCAPWVLPCWTLGPSNVHRWLISHEASASFALWTSFLKPNYKLLRAGALFCNKLIFLFTLDYFQNTGLGGSPAPHCWGNYLPEICGWAK